MNKNTIKFSTFLQDHMSGKGIFSMTPKKAEELLAKKGWVERGDDDLGTKLRRILRADQDKFVGAYQKQPRSDWTIYNKRIIALRVAWMKNYQGVTGMDIPVGAGSYVAKNEDGGESFNFKDINGSYYGYARNQMNRNYRIEKLGALRSDEFVDNVTVIFFATNPVTRGQYIVGWYKKARFYKTLQFVDHGRENRPEYICTAKVSDGHLIRPCNRTFRIAQDPEHGPGQTNHWYPMGEPWHALNQEIWEYIKSSGRKGVTMGGKGKNGRPWQVDAKKRRKVEMAAMEATARYFEERDYLIQDVSALNKGWDLEAILGKDVLCIEVKGLSRELGSIELTPNEYKNSSKKNFLLCILENALDSSKRKFHILYLDAKRGRWISEEGLELKITEMTSARVGL